MMKKTISILAIVSLACVMGCSKFLDVKPKGEVFDRNMFNSGEGYEDALYGIYSELSNSEPLYATYFILIPEAMSQNMTALSNYVYGNLAIADWESNGPVSAAKKIWSNAYQAINHVNNIIKHAEEGGEHQFEHSGLYLGEALALRALVHFDLVRFFGNPFWASETLKAKAIPYVKNYSFDITEYSSLDQVYANIIDDLTRAESLMSEDEQLVPATRTNSASGFTDARITHMNLYAVQALLARVYWSMDDMANAAIYAQKVIDSGKFTFRPLSSFVQPDNGTLDLNETIFGFYTIDQQNSNSKALGLTGSSTTLSLASDWRTLYESGSGVSTDYRLSAWFDEGVGQITKFVNSAIASSVSYTGSSIVGVNVLRIPEMYYIMAEYYLTSNPAMARTYFNKVTASRGLDPVTSLTRDDLFNERRKEFYGEGFTWHEMKKLGKDINTAAGTLLSGSVPGNYTIPIPDAEDESRNNLDTY